MPIHLLLDWDSTLTSHDTLNALAQVGYRHRLAQCETMNPGARPWSYFVDEYIADYKRQELLYLPRKEERKTIAQESAWLASLDVAERRSWNRLYEHMLFTGVGRSDVIRAARQAVKEGDVKLRRGWRELLLAASKGVTEAGVQGGISPPVVAIISVNWSGTFIRACLEAALYLSGYNEELAIIIANLPIYSNDFEGMSDNGYAVTGAIKGPSEGRNLRTSCDKVQILQMLFDPDLKTSLGPMVYVGDSATDFDSLLAANYGICMRDEPMRSSQKELKSTFERVSVRVEPLSEMISSPRERPLCASQVTVWWTNSLEQVVELISSVV
jgi:hypothetical protein